MSPELLELAVHCDVQSGYHGVDGQWVSSDAEALVQVLACLGVPIRHPDGAAEALVECRERRAARRVEPIVTCALGQHARLPVRAAGSEGRTYRLTVRHEGTSREQPDTQTIEGRLGDDGGIDLGPQTTVGCHALRLELGSELSDAWLLVTPELAYHPPDPAQWGVFAPTYALRSRLGGAGLSGQGAGDLGQLEDLVQWVGRKGGHAVSTLPLLAQFLDAGFEPSPYSPASRLFWNELYLELNALPEWNDCAELGPLLGGRLREGRLPRGGGLERGGRGTSPGAELRELEAGDRVDYARLARVRRRLLEPMSRCFFRAGGADSREFRDFCRRTGAERYAAFQATVESRREAFHAWPERARSGELDERDYREDDRRYHLYCQFRLSEQMQRLGDRARGLGLGLYLDLPVGVHGAGYDLWAERDAFLTGCSAGAPPDIVFTGGQNWGTAPLSPEGGRLQGYRYLRDVLRHHLSGAGALRIDHVMGLRRIFCVPEGMECSRGVYVGYPADELFALLTIESHRQQAMLVGEDLGTVPPEVPRALEARQIRRMHVLEYALAGHHLSFDTITGNAVTSVNTHDLVPFAGWCAGRDIELKLEAGQLDEAGAAAERSGRASVLDQLEQHLRHEGHLDGADPVEPGSRVFRLLSALLDFYGASVSPFVVLSLEDLWLEEWPQNVPGTTSESGNWSRRSPVAIDELDGSPGLVALVERLARARSVARRRAGFDGVSGGDASGGDASGGDASGGDASGGGASIEVAG